MNNLSLFFRILKKGIRGFFYKDGFLAAKALSFQTIFCLLPSFLILFFITNFLDFFQIPLFKIEEFITKSFIPAPFQNDLVNHLNLAFEHSQSVFTVVCFVFLIATFSLVTDIHDTFYHLSYKTKRTKTPLLKQFAIYVFINLSILSVLLMDFFLGTLFLKNIEINDVPSWALKISSFLFYSVLLYFLYQIMSPVKLLRKHVFYVSCIFSIILSLAQKLFLIYLQWFPGYMLVYGAIAILPILFFLVYVHWIIILNGYTILIECCSIQRIIDKKENC